MRYIIEYEHLRDEVVKNAGSLYNFNLVKNYANQHQLELSDIDFKLFVKLQENGKDIKWIMHMMGAYKLSFTEVLVNYITY